MEIDSAIAAHTIPDRKDEIPAAELYVTECT
jgi:hypothetical protein